MSNRKMSKYVTEAEATASQTASRKNIKNTFTEETFHNACLLSLKVIDIVIDHYKNKVSSKCTEKMSSFLRVLKLNRLIGSVDNSQHVSGEAVDLNITGITPRQLFNDIISGRIKLPNGQPLKSILDQCILEYPDNGGWVHLSYSEHRARKQFMLKDNTHNYTIITKEI